ncbi:Orotidine 5'-phosphate decarboxylase; AltName: Full=OMP decarboxylase; Short=OMPDCase; Short=OMPdecase; AltName: Full=Uridine 5'-monophosphate synthase; Short=UMP synthase [Serendipita indica DSM 11827]|uniref:Orotidine 5'-phosphate decarboxylase n=1 Tax=Serendipita indica (strain DSM 11827) TaxID=1109443 RepID=G4T9V9_SERID|nr:Orotidine 5'-phosphate decarboxylase; AltName: Full=OMP decarboxylase; Short=OMPDCase; Short=OMPdecase; AltName: Full=Uridine 5'-monophosphate synthase; Short=UMP synthase [Serendipita indica DSM 11827]CCA68102.1 related to orotidine 5`-phosphate decarboxylase [Serendipita indica DSM 11827]
MSKRITQQTYGERSKNYTNPAARRLLEIMDRKKSNLCLSIDVTTTEKILNIVDATHVDIIEDFSEEFITRLRQLSDKYDFLIFEDRKFADIGNTVVHQYSRGIHKIASWAHITNAHPLPGPGIITGLASVGLASGRGLLLLAEMSSAGCLAKGSYTAAAVQMAREKRDFVIGFIAMQRVETLYPPMDVAKASADPGAVEDFLIMTPGVGLDVAGDAMGQQYRTPHAAVYESGSDIIIVGRGIYGKGDDVEEMKRQAERYRQAGWEAYLSRLQTIAQ